MLPVFKRTNEKRVRVQRLPFQRQYPNAEGQWPEPERMRGVREKVGRE